MQAGEILINGDCVSFEVLGHLIERTLLFEQLVEIKGCFGMENARIDQVEGCVQALQ